MYRRIAEVIAAFILAFAILFISMFRASSTRYAFTQASLKPTPTPDTNHIDYDLAYPGEIDPDDTLWPIKALRDKIMISAALSSVDRSNIYLLLADKRLASSSRLFDEGKPEEAVSTLTKAEKYLEKAVQEEKKARENGENTVELLGRLTLATLKHRQIIEGEIMDKAPEDARPIVNSTADYPRYLYQETRDANMSVGRDAPKSPFNQ